MKDRPRAEHELAWLTNGARLVDGHNEYWTFAGFRYYGKAHQKSALFVSMRHTHWRAGRKMESSLWIVHTDTVLKHFPVLGNP
jgi:hypothetical protein